MCIRDSYQAVHAGKSVLGGGQPHIVLVGKQLVVERQADGVGTLLLDEGRVGKAGVVGVFNQGVAVAATVAARNRKAFIGGAAVSYTHLATA